MLVPAPPSPEAMRQVRVSLSANRRNRSFIPEGITDWGAESKVVGQGRPCSADFQSTSPGQFQRANKVPCPAECNSAIQQGATLSYEWSPLQSHLRRRLWRGRILDAIVITSAGTTR